MKRVTGIAALLFIIAASSIVDAHASRESVLADATGAEVKAAIVKAGADLNRPEVVLAAAELTSAYSDVFAGYYDLGRQICSDEKFQRLDEGGQALILARDKMTIAKEVFGKVDITRTAEVFMAGCENK